MKKYPMLLKPVSKTTIWGGNKLKNKYSKVSEFDNIAESWELSVRPNEMCSVMNGIYSDLPLCDVISLDKVGFLGKKSEKYDRFPLLIKFIDAADKLSIQVHPDNEYSLEKENELGKTEMWYIIEADEGSQLVYGFREGITLEDFSQAVAEGKTEDTLNFVDVHAGDVFFIPSGQVHAIGAGIVIAEIQQNSDVTYRIFDFNRRQKDGSLRQLHTDKALDVIKLRTKEELDETRFSVDASEGGELLASCEYFVTRKYSLNNESVILFSNDDSFVSILAVAGDKGIIKTPSSSFVINKGDSWFVPSGMGEFEISGNIDIIITTIN